MPQEERRRRTAVDRAGRENGEEDKADGVGVLGVQRTGLAHELCREHDQAHALGEERAARHDPVPEVVHLRAPDISETQGFGRSDSAARLPKTPARSALPHHTTRRAESAAQRFECRHGSCGARTSSEATATRHGKQRNQIVPAARSFIKKPDRASEDARLCGGEREQRRRDCETAAVASVMHRVQIQVGNSAVIIDRASFSTAYSTEVQS